jgi:hypothetical protein
MLIRSVLSILAIAALAFTAQAASRAPKPATLEVRISLAGQGTPITTIAGKTNLPNGTRLQVDVARPYALDAPQRQYQGLAACVPDCLPWHAETSVKSGVFIAGPFVGSDGPARLHPGLYAVTVTVVPSAQTLAVQRLMGGRQGLLLRGPLVRNMLAGSTLAGQDNMVFHGFPVAVPSHYKTDTWLPRTIPPPIYDLVFAIYANAAGCKESNGDAASQEYICRMRANQIAKLEAQGWCLDETGVQPEGYCFRPPG